MQTQKHGIAVQILGTEAVRTFLVSGTIVTCCPARKLIPKAADMPSTAAGVTPAVMHAALQPSRTTNALACALRQCHLFDR